MRKSLEDSGDRIPRGMVAHDRIRLIAFPLFLFFFFCSTLNAEIIDRFGEGYLEKVEGQLVLHVSGSPYKRGEQHGRLLKTQIQQNVTTFLAVPKSTRQTERAAQFKKHIRQLTSHTSQNLLEEMLGLAIGSDVPFDKIVALNLFPEMFHCSAITAKGAATKEGELYHVRVLDYAIGKGIQNTAVLMVATPEQGYPFLNVTYAGFIGSVTGMNTQKIAIGEIGGQGYGSWDGVPMAFLIRSLLEGAATLAEAKEILKNAPRTCEYFYILSDGKTGDSLGVYATKEEIQFIEPGTNYALLPASEPTPTQCLSPCKIEEGAYQTVLYRPDETIAAIACLQPEECLILTGLTHPQRYPVIAERLVENYGKIDEKILQQIIQGPAGKDSNLHNAIFLPSKLKVWISHAGPENESAYTQPYVEFSMRKLLQIEDLSTRE